MTYIPELDLELNLDEVIPDPIVSAPNRRELWLKIGQSNSVGTDGGDRPDFADLDRRDPRLWEYSRGTDKATYRAAPSGEFMVAWPTGQDDTGDNGFGFHFGKRRLELHPEIDRLVLVNRGVGGTGFAGNRWNVGDDLYDAALADTLAALAADPQLRFGGFLWHQGESDAGQGQAFYETALAAMVAGLRSSIPGAADAPFLVGTMVESWIAADEAARRPIDDAHRNVAAYIDNSAVVDFADITDLQDIIHFATGALRTMGVRYGEAVELLNSEPVYYSHHLKVVDGEVVDLDGNGGDAYTMAIAEDETRGEVMDSQNVGSQTSMLLNPAESTKACWVNVQTAPAGFGNLMSGTITPGVDDSHFWGWDGHGQTVTAATAAGNEPLSNHLTVGEWAHVALSFDGTLFQMYVDGVLVSTGSVLAQVLNYPPVVELCTFSGNGVNQLDALIDDVVVLPWASDAAGVAAIMERSAVPEVETCPPVGTSVALPVLLSTRPAAGEPGTIVAPAAATGLNSGTNGVPRESPIQFHGFLPGDVVDAVIRVTRLGAGGGGIVLQPSGVFSNTSGGSDYLVEYELPEGMAFEWAVHPASAGGSELFAFSANPVTEYAQGPGGVALTLPFTGNWTNGNNGAPSGLGFDASNTLSFRTNGVAGAGSSFTVALRAVPTLVEEDLCSRSESLLAYVGKVTPFVQRGVVDISTSTVVFPEPFADTDYTLVGSADATPPLAQYVDGKTTTQANLNWHDGVGLVSPPVGATWVAIGTKP